MKLLNTLVALNAGFFAYEMCRVSNREPLLGDKLLDTSDNKCLNRLKGAACIALAPALILSEALQPESKCDCS